MPRVLCRRLDELVKERMSAFRGVPQRVAAAARYIVKDCNARCGLFCVQTGGLKEAGKVVCRHRKDFGKPHKLHGSA